MKDWVKVGRQYAQSVIAGTTPACRWIKFAAERSERDFEKFASNDSIYRFTAKRANAVCDFISALRHIQDGIATKAGDLFELLPWQVWLLITVFGWVWRESGRRRFRRVYLEEPKGNGKSTLAAAIVVYVAFAEGVHGAQAVCAASLREQARIVLDAARQMVLQDEKLQRYMGLEVAANKIVQARTGSRLWALSAKGTSSEGLAVNLAVLDELHAVRGRELYDSLAGACSKRVDSLFLTVTTAGDDSAGIAFEVRGFAERILAGEAEDDTFFSALYTIDPDDDWTLPTTWQKANPSWGVSVDPRAVAEEAKRAQQIPGARYNFRSRHLCEWVLNGGNDPFLDDRAIRRCFDPGLEESRFDGTPCALAADLASRIDMCAVARIHSRRLDSKIHHYAFLKCFLPTSQERASVAYAGWAERGELVFTSGKSTDQDAIENHIAAALSLHKVRDISFDPMQSNMLVSHLEKRRAGVTLEIAQSAKYLTPGVLELQEAVTDGRFHTNSQILIWALGNLRVRTVGSNMLQPARPADRTKKIDAAVAVIMALRSVALVPLDDVKPTPRILLMDNRPGGSIIDLTNQRRIVSSGGADAPACEPERPGMTLVRILGTGDLKWLPETAAALLIADGAAEKI